MALTNVKIIPGFDSFESIVFRGYEVYITIEIKILNNEAPTKIDSAITNDPGKA